jgi:hypothetical protein
MANRKGTYLSDENVKARCPEFFPVPMGKSYGLFRLSDGSPAQRPQNVLQALREMARIQNVSYKSLERKYMEDLVKVPNELIVSVPALSRNTNQVASVAFTQMGGVQAQGFTPVATPVATPVVAPVLGTPTGKAKNDYDTVLGQLGVFSQGIQKDMYRALYQEAKASGANIGVFSASMMDNSMNKKKRIDLFKRLLEQTNIDVDDVETIISQKLANIPSSSNTPMPPNIATSNPFSALPVEP